jgi:hypothetical protein
MADELKPIKDAPDDIRNIITKVIDHEKRNIHVKRGIKDDVVDIIKKEIQ